MLRKCSRCQRELALGLFAVDRSRFQGRAYVCRECRCAERVAPGPDLAERRFMRGFAREWCRDCTAWKPAEDVRAGQCRGHRAATQRRRYAEDETVRLARRQHSHARKRGVAPIPPVGQRFLMEMFDGLCAYCRAPATTWDHVEPVSRGGRTTPGNIVPACVSCNSSKRDRDVFEWMESRGITPSDLLLDRIAFADSSLYG